MKLTREEILAIRDLILTEVGRAMVAGDKEKIDKYNSISNKLYEMER